MAARASRSQARSRAGARARDIARYMIVFRHADPRLPFLWEDEAQPPGRWHGVGEEPAHYFSDTPDGAWGEFLRHEEIRDLEDLATIRRAIWAVEIHDEPAAISTLRATIQTGDLESYEACRTDARRLRKHGATRLDAPSAALLSNTASGHVVDGGLRPGPPLQERTIVLYGKRPSLVGWRAASEGQPSRELLLRVRHFGSRRYVDNLGAGDIM